jgi:hypothetical protein
VPMPSPPTAIGLQWSTGVLSMRPDSDGPYPDKFLIMIQKF